MSNPETTETLRLTALPSDDGPYERWELRVDLGGRLIGAGKYPLDHAEVSRAITAYRERGQDAELFDNAAIARFAIDMIDKMARSRAKGRGGWQNCSTEDLWRMLREHVEKGDPVDVANFAMMIYANRQRVSEP